MFMNRFLSNHNFLFLWDVSLGVRLLYFVVNVCFIFIRMYPKGTVAFCIPTVYESSSYPTSSPALGIVSVCLVGWLGLLHLF